ncbi:MAG: hypothetical protein ACKVP3_15290 [Hyphomicrobiaceae bacterium]
MFARRCGDFLERHDHNQRGAIIGMAIGAWVAGYAYDQLGTYAPAFLFGIVLNIANIVIIWCLTALGIEKKSATVGR